MIGVFADPEERAFGRWILKAARSIDIAKSEVKFIAVDRGETVLRAREYGAMIREMEACVIDVSYKGMLRVGVRLGSLSVADRIRRNVPAGGVVLEEEFVSSFDSRIALVVRSEAEKKKITEQFGRFYAMIDISNGFNERNREILASWMKDTVTASTPKVFVSYRSNQRELAGVVAQELRKRGAAVWFDEWAIEPGDSIPEEINRGLGWCTHMVVIVDDVFFESKWAADEIWSVLYREHSDLMPFSRGYPGRRVVLPLFLVDPRSESIPPMLAHLRGVRLGESETPKAAVERLWRSIEGHTS